MLVLDVHAIQDSRSIAEEKDHAGEIQVQIVPFSILGHKEQWIRCMVKNKRQSHRIFYIVSLADVHVIFSLITTDIVIFEILLGICRLLTMR